MVATHFLRGWHLFHHSSLLSLALLLFVQKREERRVVRGEVGFVVC